jgi:uncharacterized cupredoxin-like copper-binding protein
MQCTIDGIQKEIGMKCSVVAALTAVVLIAACGVNRPAAVPRSGSIEQVNVSLVEFSVTATPATARAGRVLFKVHNDGNAARHEFVVVRTDLTFRQLPRNADGSFDEEGAGVRVIGEIETIQRHATRTLMLDLEAGHYMLLCNLVVVVGGKVRSHFAEGMHTDFTVL